MKPKVDNSHRTVQQLDLTPHLGSRAPRLGEHGARPRRSHTSRRMREAVPEYRTLLGEVTHSTLDPFLAHCLERWIERWSLSLLDDLTADDIQSYLAEQIGRGFTQTEVHRERTLFETFFRWACRCGWAECNPTRKVGPVPKMPTPRCVAWNAVEQRRLLRSCQDFLSPMPAGSPEETPPRYLYPLAVIGLQSGLRTGNLIHLEWRHIDFERARVVIPPKEVRSGRALDAPLGVDAMRVIKNLLASARALDAMPQRILEVAGLPIKGSQPDARRVFYDFRHIRRRAGITAGDIHSLRLTFVRNCAFAGVPLESAARMADWENLETLRDLYCRSMPRVGAPPSNTGTSIFKRRLPRVD